MPWGGLGDSLKGILAVDEAHLRQQLEQALATNRSLTGNEIRLRQELESCERQLSAQTGGLELDLRKLEIDRDEWRKRAKEEEQVAQKLLRCKQPRGKPAVANPELGRLLRRLERNIAREWRVAMEGRILKKRSEKHGKNEVRLCQVHDKELRWGHAPGPLGSSAKKLLLEEVFRIDYGLMSVAAREEAREHDEAMRKAVSESPGQAMMMGIPGLASVGSTVGSVGKSMLSTLKQESPDFQESQALPWLCFSLVTMERSYDFICPDEHAARCFVVVISRICEGNAVGAVRGRQQFEALKGWCKLKTWCKQEGTSLPKALLEAVRRVGATLPPPAPAPRDEQQQPESGGGVLDMSSFLSEGYPRHSSSNSQPTMDLLEFCGETQPARTEIQHVSAGSLPRTSTASVKSKAPMRPPPGKTPPKEGQTWVFTGAVECVDVFKDPDGKEQVNQMKCRAANQERRMVTIISAPAGYSMIEIRGTEKMKFVKGWILLSDSSGSWVVEQAPKTK